MNRCIARQKRICFFHSFASVFGSLVLTDLFSTICCSHVSPVSMATGTKMFVSVILVYFDVLKIAAWLASALARMDHISQMCN